MTERTVAGLPRSVALLLLILSLASVGGYGLLWPEAPVLDGDSPQYLEVSRDLADWRIDQVHDRAPGYPVLLALTGSFDVPSRSLLYVSLLLHVTAVWMLVVSLHAVGANRRWLSAATVVLMLPPFVEPAGYVMTENLAEFLLAAGFAGLILWFGTRRLPWLMTSALALAFAAITRPTYQLLALALAVALLLPFIVRRLGLTIRDARTAATALIAVSVLVVGGLCAGNKVAFGYFGVAPTFGMHLSTKTMSFVERLPDEYSVARDILVRERDQLLTKPGGTHNPTQTIWHARDELSRTLHLDTPALSSYLVRMNLRLIARAPIEYLEDVGRAFAAYWFPASGQLATMDSSALRWLWALLHLAIVAFFFWQVAVAITGSTAGLAATQPAIARTAFVACLAIVGYTMVLSCFLDIGEPRQRRPTDTLIVVACVLGAERYRRR